MAATPVAGRAAESPAGQGPALPDLRLSKTGPAGSFTQDTIVYQITFWNAGSTIARQVVVADVLPAGVTFVDASHGGVEAGGVVTWPVRPALSNDNRFTFTVRVTAPCPAVLLNTASIASSTADANPADNTDAVSTTVVGPRCGSPDVSIRKSGPAGVATDAEIAYTIRVTNHGPGRATGVVVTDELPAGVSFLDASGGIAPVAGVLEWPAVDLDPLATLEYTLRVVAPGCPATLVNRSRVWSDGDPVPSNDASSVTTAVSGLSCDPIANLGIDKTGPPAASPGDTVAWSLRVWNDGPDTATDVIVSDTLPAAGRFLDASGGAGAPVGGVITWPAMNLAPGDTVELNVRFEAPACARIDNFAAVASLSTVDPDPSDNQAVATTLVDSPICAGVDVVIHKEANGTLFLRGDTIEFTLRIWNEGPLTALNVAVVDSLPRNHGFLDATGGATLSGDALVWPLIPRLPVGDTVEHTVRVAVPGSFIPEEYTNVGRAYPIRSTDTDPSSNRDEATVQLGREDVAGPDLAVTKEVVDTSDPGIERILRYRITVANHGTGPTTAPIELTDSLPVGATFESGIGSGWVVARAGSTLGAVQAGVLGPGSVTTLHIAVRLADTVSGEVCNVVRVTTPGDLDASDNRAEVCSVVPGAEAIELAKTADRPEVGVGHAVQYRVTVVAVGGFPLSDVAVVDVLPPGFIYEAGTARLDGLIAPDPAIASRSLRFELGTVAAPDTVVIAYVARAGPGAASGEAVNRARASYRGGSSNEARAVVRVTPGPFTDLGMIVGTVFADSSGAVAGEGGANCLCLPSDRAQRGERGIPGVRVVLQNGTSALTDSNGRYLIPGLSPRTWVVKVDRSTLPAGVGLIRLSNRHAEDGGTVLVDLKKGELHRADFAAAWSGRDAMAEIERRAADLETAASQPVEAATGPDPPGRGTGLAPGIPWTRYRPLMPDAWAGRLIPDSGPLGDLAGFPQTVDTTGGGGFGRTPAAAVSPPISGAPSSHPGLAMGLIEARLDFRERTASELGGLGRDAFEDALLSLSVDGDDDRFHGGARAALLYRGRAADRFDLLVRLDTEEDDRAVLFRDITPDDFYPIAGDASMKGFDARSRSRVYARVGADDSFLTWGDFNTARAASGMAGMRALGEYARTLNGALHHYESDRLAIDAFASRDRSQQIVDVVRAEGVSGPYRLSRSDGLVNSERVELVTRDRDQSAVVLRAQVMERFTDYTIEPVEGRILFRRPVPAFDEDLNPVEIRVTYEVEGDTDRFWVWGANARLQPLSGLELGGSLVRDENPLRPLDVGSLNGTVELPGATWLTAEWARTAGSPLAAGDATRVELIHESDRVRLRGFFVATDSTFRNPTSGYRSGREELGLLGRARLGAGTAAFAEVVSSEDGGTGRTRRGARIGIDRRLTEWLSGQAGYRWAETSGGASVGGAEDETNAIGIRLQAALAGEPAERRGTAFVEFEQDVSDSRRRRAALGADYRVLTGVRVYARHEFINSLTGPWHLDGGLERNATVLGVATEARSGQAVFSEYRIREAIDGREAQAAIGLRNAWRVSDGVRLSASLERLTPVGPGSTDATAVTGAVEFTGSPDWKGSVRTEYQARAGEDNLFGSLGYARRLSPAFSLLGNAVFSTRMDGERAWSRSRIGIAYRQVETNRWNGLARWEHRYDRSTDPGAGAARSSANTHILAGHVDFQPVAGATLRGQWTSRFAAERIAGVRTSGTTHLAGGRGTVDIGSRFDLGVIGRSLFTAGSGSARYGVGGEIGVRLPADLRLAAGYNLFGFRDDLSRGDEYTDRGAWVQIAFRFDEGLWTTRPRGAAGESDCRCPLPPDRAPPPPDETDADPLSPELDVVIRAPSRVLAGDSFRVEFEARNLRDARGAADSVSVSARLEHGGRFDPALGLDVSWPGPAALLTPDSAFSRFAFVRADSLRGSALADSIVLSAMVAVRPGEKDSLNNSGRTVIRVLRGPDNTRPGMPPCAIADADDCAPDLFVSITGPHRVGAGDSIRYEFTTTNIGNSPADRVESTASFPDLRGLSDDGAEPPVRSDSTVLVASRLEPGSTVSWSMTLPPAGRPGMLFVKTDSRTTTTEFDLSNNADSVKTLVPCDAGDACLAMRIDGPDRATMGDTVIYTISADNPGSSSLGGVLLSGGTDPAVRVVGVNGGRAVGLEWTVPGIGPGASHAQTLALECSADRIVLGFGARSDSTRASATHETQCLRSDLAVRIDAIADGPGVRRSGDRVTWRIVTRNLGPADARDVEVRAVPDAGATIESASPTPAATGARVSWPVIGLLAAGDSAEHVLRIASGARDMSARIEAYAIARTPDGDPTNNGTVADVALIPPPGTPDVGPGPGGTGLDRDPIDVDPVRRDPAGLVVDIAPLLDLVDRHTVPYRITVSNPAAVPALEVRVGATWPADVAFLSASRGALTSGDSLLLPPVGTLAPGETLTDTLVVVMPAAPDTVTIDAFATAFTEGPVTAEPVPDDVDANNRDSSMALMVIQEVTIPDTVFTGGGAGFAGRLFLFLPWLLVLLLLLLIAWLVWRLGWWVGPGPAGRQEEREDEESREPTTESEREERRRVPPVSPPQVPWQEATGATPFGPFFLPPVPGLPGLPEATGPIEIGGTRGTAYLVRHDRLVTASHVVLNRQRGDRVTVRLKERTIEATVIAVDPHVDIAILAPVQPIRDIRPLELSATIQVPAWWRGYGFARDGKSPGIEFGGSLLQPSARDRFGRPTMTLTSPGLAVRFLEDDHGLAGSPIVVGNTVVGHLRGNIPHPDTLRRTFADLLMAAPARRIIELLREADEKDGGGNGKRPADAPEPVRWSIAPELDRCETGGHATLVYRRDDAEFARRMAARLEGSGFAVRLQQRERGPVAADGSSRLFLLYSRAWRTDADSGPLLPDPEGMAPIVVRVDDSPLPTDLERFEAADFCGHEPDRGIPFDGLVKLLVGRTQPVDSHVDAVLDATGAVLDLVRSAKGRVKRTRFAIKRWRESGLPGHSPELLAARQLIEDGQAAEAVEILKDVPAGAEASGLAARALAAIGRIDEAIEKLEALRSTDDDDSTAGLLAELCWKKWVESGRRRVAWLRKAFEIEARRYARTRDPHAGIEAARYALVSGEIDEAGRLAGEVRDAVAARDERDAGVLGQACLLLGDEGSAIEALGRAVAAKPGRTAAIGALYRRVREILSALPDDAKVGAEVAKKIEAIFYLPRVATIDPQARVRSESELRTELRALLDRHDVGVGVCCPDSATALVFAEEVLRRGGHITAILPLPRDEFVAVRIAAAAAARVEAVLGHERTTGVDSAGAAGGMPAGPAADGTATYDAVLAAASRAADERGQAPIVYSDKMAASSGAPDFLLEPGEAERVGLGSLSPAAPETEAPATAPGGRTRDVFGIQREAPVPEGPDVYKRLFCVAIGIDAYTQWNPLYNAVNDARELAQTLESGFGFTVRSLINEEATRDRIRSLVLDEVAGELEEDDLLIIFFAGHGHTQRASDDEEQGYLVPVDARVDNVDDLLPMEEVVSWPDRLPCEDILCIFDSCFSGFAAFAGGVTKRGDSDDARIAISAGSAEQPVLDGGAPGGLEGHSIFTAYLLLRLRAALDAARNGNDDVDTMRLYVDLRDRVTKATAWKQTPVYGFLSGHGAGEIWLQVRKPDGT